MANTQALMCVLLVSFLWGGWQLVARASGVSPMWVAVIVTLASVPVVIFASGVLTHADQPSIQGVLIVCAAGVMLGFGMLTYSKLVSTPSWDLSTWVPIAAAGITAVTALGGIIFFGEAVSAKKAAGLILAALGIFLLS